MFSYNLVSGTQFLGGTAAPPVGEEGQKNRAGEGIENSAITLKIKDVAAIDIRRLVSACCLQRQCIIHTWMIW